MPLYYYYGLLDLLVFVLVRMVRMEWKLEDEETSIVARAMNRVGRWKHRIDQCFEEDREKN